MSELCFSIAISYHYHEQTFVCRHRERFIPPKAKKLLHISNLNTLTVRREKLNLQFAKKAVKHPRFKRWFKCTNPDQPIEKAHYATVTSRNMRLLKTPIPYFTKLLNSNNGY